MPEVMSEPCKACQEKGLHYYNISAGAYDDYREDTYYSEKHFTPEAFQRACITAFEQSTDEVKFDNCLATQGIHPLLYTQSCHLWDYQGYDYDAFEVGESAKRYRIQREPYAYGQKGEVIEVQS